MERSDTRSRVTALVPAYQAAGFIQPTLDSLSAQTCESLDVLISVDLCDDDTYALCAAHAARDRRFRVVRQTERLGYVGNCNALLRQADADYVLFAFHDDVLLPAYVERLRDTLDARPGAVMAFTDVLLTEVDGRQEHWTYVQLEGVRDPVERGRRMLARAGRWWVPNRGVFRLREASRIGGLKTHGAGEFSADWPWLFHMSLLGEFVRVPETLCHKFYKPGSLSRSWAFSGRQHYEVAAACMRELWSSELTADEKLGLSGPLASWMARLRAQLDTVGERPLPPWPVDTRARDGAREPVAGARPFRRLRFY